MNFKITENKKNHTVTVAAVASGDITKKDAANTIKIKRYLEENNIKVIHCIKEDYINNRAGKVTGEWVFSTSSTKTVDKPSPPVVSSNRVERTKKSSKSKDE